MGQTRESAGVQKQGNLQCKVIEKILNDIKVDVIIGKNEDVAR